MMTTGSATAPHQPDPIRIVPLAGVEEMLLAPATPHLTYRGGPLLTAVEVVTVFWGGAWQSRQSQIDAINGFYDAILQSAYLDNLAEYSVSGQTIGRGARTGTATITTPEPGTSVTDAALRSFLQDAVGSSLPAATANSLYAVYLPAGTVVSAGGGRSCLTFCGYHDSINGNLFYAVLPDPGCTGCLGGLQPVDALTSISSHELAEAITDPVPGTGWYDDANGEIGDICAWQSETVVGYTVQKLWSNTQGACR
jgi:hypothetical protein